MAHTHPRRARRAIFVTYLGLWAETIVLAFWPLFAVGCLGFGALRLTDPSQWAVELYWLILFVAVGAILWTGWYGRRRFYWPRWAVAQARLDAQMPGRPLQTLQDTPATTPDHPAVQALWARHLDRMHQQANLAQSVPPVLRVSPYDPFALRYMALLIALVGGLFGLGFAQRPMLIPTGQIAAIGPSWEAWIKPPAYTRKPTIYLNDVIGERVTVPKGSEVTFRLYGPIGDLAVTETISARTAFDTSTVDDVQRFEVAQTGDIAVYGSDPAQWDIVATPDRPPQVQLSARFEVDELDQIRQQFLARDDYGVTDGRAYIRLSLDQVNRSYGLAATPLPRSDFELQLPLTITGDRTQFEAVLNEDLSQNPWVNLPVEIVLEVEDIMGQTGQSATIDTHLPGRRFFDPMAKAIIEQRRDILWTPDNAQRVAQVLRAMSVDAQTVYRDGNTADAVFGVIGQLEQGINADQADDIAETLWTIAINIEEGDLASAQEALQRAQDKLAEAIRNGASPDDIERLMDELRRAQQDYMREFAERQPPQPTGEQQPQDGEQVTQDQLQNMMDRLQQLMEEGRMAEAQDLLDEINRLMENLQMQQGQNGQGQQPSQGQEAMEGLADTLRDQQDLSDDAFREYQDGPTGENGQSLADRQQALRDELNRQRQTLPPTDGPAGRDAEQSLDNAGRAMDRAEEALRNGDLPGALDGQAEAMEELRDGLRNLGRALAAQNQPGQGQSDQQPGNTDDADGAVDPLGRRNGTLPNQTGPDQDMLTENDLRQRSQDLLDEIERRRQDLNRSDEERGFLDRLIERF
ncbi:MAG: DUF4175 family protein [Pseudomonadota bacterium]